MNFKISEAWSRCFDNVPNRHSLAEAGRGTVLVLMEVVL